VLAELLKSSADSGLKKKRGHFTRGGPIQPDLLVTLLLYLVADGGRRGYRHTLDAFWDEAKRSGLTLPTAEPVSAAAFCKARRKLKPQAIRGLLHDVAHQFERDHGKQHRFAGRRVLAIDSSKISVQRSPELFAEFGRATCSLTPQISVNVLFDVISKTPLDASIAPFSSDERDHVSLFLAHLRPGDVLVLDRGYPSYALLHQLKSLGIDFVVRVPTKNGFTGIAEFVKSGRLDQQLVLDGKKNQSEQPLELRAIRSCDPQGHPWVLVTTLHRSEFSPTKIRELYARRWQIELFFRLEKGDYLGHHQFHARTPDGVRQELFGLLLFVALTRHLMASAARIHRVTYVEISQKGAILAVSRRLVDLLLEKHPVHARQLLADLLHRVQSRLDKPRPGRSFPRRSFRPRPRWNSDGRFGGNDYGTIG